MGVDWTRPLTVDEMYGDWDYEAAVEMLEQSLEPRRSSVIFDSVASLGVGPKDNILDIGGRDATHGLMMAERFGCRVTVVDPAPANLADGEANLAEHESGHLVTLRPGLMEDIPTADDSFTVIFSRDMISHVDDLPTGFSECARVLAPGGSMVIHANFQTDLMEPREAERLYNATAAVPRNADVGFFEDSLRAAGFTVSDLDVVGSEWYEATQEAGISPNYLLQISRLRRAEDRFVQAFGEVAYRSMYGNALWGCYLLFGKLEARLYTLIAPGSSA